MRLKACFAERPRSRREAVRWKGLCTGCWSVLQGSKAQDHHQTRAASRGVQCALSYPRSRGAASGDAPVSNVQPHSLAVHREGLDALEVNFVDARGGAAVEFTKRHI